MVPAENDGTDATAIHLRDLPPEKWTASMIRTEKMITMKDAARINLVVCQPETDPYRLEGAVLLIHGFGEHAGRYDTLAGRFCRRNYLFYTFDQRGHGKTPGRRGVVSSYEAMLSDIDEIRARILRENPGLPIILYGHSMGGNLVINYLIRKDCTGIACAVVSSPWLRLYKPVTPALSSAVGTAARFLPSLAIKSALNLPDLTRDREIVEKTAKDPLYHNIIGVRLYTQIEEAAAYAMENANRLQVKTLLLIAEHDRIVSAQTETEFSDRAGELVTAVSWPGAYHELHNEPEAEEIFEVVRSFIRIYVSHRPERNSVQ